MNRCVQNNSDMILFHRANQHCGPPAGVYKRVEIFLKSVSLCPQRAEITIHLHRQSVTKTSCKCCHHLPPHRSSAWTGSMLKTEQVKLQSLTKGFSLYSDNLLMSEY